MQALIEMCAGNYSNQVIAFKGQVIISIETVLQEDFTSSTVSYYNLAKLIFIRLWNHYASSNLQVLNC